MVAVGFSLNNDCGYFLVVFLKWQMINKSLVLSSVLRNMSACCYKALHHYRPVLLHILPDVTETIHQYRC